jgi:hypothetical protein
MAEVQVLASFRAPDASFTFGKPAIVATNPIIMIRISVRL